MALFSYLLYLSLAAFAFVDAGRLIQPDNKDDVVPDTYIVIMKDNISATCFRNHASWVADIHRSNSTRKNMGFDGSIRRTYDIHGMKGYNGRFDKDAIREIANSPDVRLKTNPFLFACSEFRLTSDYLLGGLRGA
jgi:hypothetical protein